MTNLFPHWPLLSAFLLASLLLAVTPGPGVIYIVTRSVVEGRRYGMLSVVGVALGNLGNALIASLGLAAVLAVSSVAFAIVKYAGAAYLIYLGVQMFRAPSAEKPAPEPATATPKRVIRDGFVVAFFNPKTAIFFAAFIPQFLSGSVSIPLSTLVLASLFVVIAAATDCVYAFAAGSVGPALRRGGSRRIGRRLGGGVFIGLGLFTAFAGLRGAR